MKNIHILPTYNQSRLYYFNGKKSEFYLYPSNQLLTPKNNVYSNQNIYITSDEEIENCWFVNLTNNEIGYIKNNIGTQKNAKKIILTTDIDLIKDGVQAIEEDFLKWFVKNPSCEFVEVEEIEPVYGHQNNTGNVIYRLIIPKEEPNIISDWLEQNRNPEIDKQVEKEFEYLSKQEIKLEEVFNDDKKENIKKFIDEINNPSEPNQALKEAFEKYSEYLEDFENKNTYEHGFKDGAKWQQEQMYSEEEVIAFGEFIFKHSLLTHTRGVKSLFEQFKKK